jgi:hypothetical protein
MKRTPSLLEQGEGYHGRNGNSHNRRLAAGVEKMARKQGQAE